MMGLEAKFRKTLSMPGLLAQMRRCFEGVEDEVAGRGLSLADCLMSGLAIFSLKYPSLLQFEQDARGLGESAHEPRRENLRSLFGVERAPSDVRLRERLDEVDPRELRAPFKRLFARAQRGGALAGFEWLEGRYLLSVDGTGHFSSSKVHCANCCERRHKFGTTTYYHQSLCAVLVHPQRREVVPVVAPEAIVKSDGRKKNDCERRAAKRLLTELRREHPHLALVVVEDGLASNGPHIRLLKELDMRFVLGAKPGEHKALFEWVEQLEAHPPADPAKRVVGWETVDGDGTTHCFRWLNGVPLNDTHFDLEVNFLGYRERRRNGHGNGLGGVMVRVRSSPRRRQGRAPSRGACLSGGLARKKRAKYFWEDLHGLTVNPPRSRFKAPHARCRAISRSPRECRIRSPGGVETSGAGVARGRLGASGRRRPESARRRRAGTAGDTGYVRKTAKLGANPT